MMGHRKWDRDVWQSTCYDSFLNEHNALYEAWEDAMNWQAGVLDENNRLDRELDEARKRIAELESPLRVPFSDEQIERMARAARDAFEHYPDDWENSLYKHEWRSAIRAALAAGGLEPCAPPEYDPADVALAPTGDMWKTPIDGGNNGPDLRDDTDSEGVKAILVLSADEWCYFSPERAAKYGAWLSSYAAAHGVPSAPTGNALYDRLVKAEAKVEQQYAELVSLDSQVNDLRTQLARESEWVRQYKQDRDDALAELAAVTAERDKAIRESGNRMGELLEARSDLAALRERAAVPVSVDEVEALARVLHKAYRDSRRIPEPWEDCDAQHSYRAEARAAIAHIRKRPEGLPTPDQFNAHFARIDRGLFEHDVIELIYDYLAPWLRDPVGWELDVTWEELYNTYQAKLCGNQGSWQAVLDLCRARIKPVFECKECAARREHMLTAPDVQCAECERWKSYGTKMEDNARVLAKRLDAARAALEGE